MLRGKRKMRLSRAALETLAIIAYKQPVTKSEIEAIRGVDSSGTLATLLERSLVTIKGRSTVVGRPRWISRFSKTTRSTWRACNWASASSDGGAARSTPMCAR